METRAHAQGGQRLRGHDPKTSRDTTQEESLSKLEQHDAAGTEPLKKKGKMLQKQRDALERGRESRWNKIGEKKHLPEIKKEPTPADDETATKPITGVQPTPASSPETSPDSSPTKDQPVKEQPASGSEESSVDYPSASEGQSETSVDEESDVSIEDLPPSKPLLKQTHCVSTKKNSEEMKPPKNTLERVKEYWKTHAHEFNFV